MSPETPVVAVFLHLCDQHHNQGCRSSSTGPVIPEMVCASEGDDPYERHTPQPLKTMEQITHEIRHLDRWFATNAFLRTLASVGLIPLTYEGLTYDAEQRHSSRGGIGDYWLRPFRKPNSRHQLSGNDPKAEKVSFNMSTGDLEYIVTQRRFGRSNVYLKRMKAINFDDYVGGDADDNVYGTRFSNVLNGRWGKNYLNGGEGSDCIEFGIGEDIVVGGRGEADRAVCEQQYFDLSRIVDVVDINAGETLSGLFFRDSGKYIVVKNTDGKLSYIHESTEYITGWGGGNSNYKFQDAWESIRVELRDPDQEATREHFLTGTDRSEDFYGGAGRDNITGAGGRDQFQLDVFDRSADSWANMDRVHDLDSNDKIVIHSSILGINPDDAVFEIVSNGLERANAMNDEDVHFAYDTRSGDIFWNSNGAADGGGKGLAKLVAESEFSHVGQIDFV